MKSFLQIHKTKIELFTFNSKILLHLSCHKNGISGSLPFMNHLHLQYHNSLTVPFYTNNTVHPFLFYKYSNTLSFCLTSHPKQLIPFACSAKVSLSIYLSLSLQRISCTHAISIRLSPNASTNSPDLPVSESTFQVPTRNG